MQIHQMCAGNLRGEIVMDCDDLTFIQGGEEMT